MTPIPGTLTEEDYVNQVSLEFTIEPGKTMVAVARVNHAAIFTATDGTSRKQQDYPVADVHLDEAEILLLKDAANNTIGAVFLTSLRAYVLQKRLTLSPIMGGPPAPPEPSPVVPGIPFPP